mmetsp:Transcript_15262/g.46987  ORF Transcript_15262/g.46987 Transcript_15262/m.46987 type:complete len:91 (-) Transcript_15262:2309-2581(-)
MARLPEQPAAAQHAAWAERPGCLPARSHVGSQWGRQASAAHPQCCAPAGCCMHRRLLCALEPLMQWELQGPQPVHRTQKGSSSTLGWQVA